MRTIGETIIILRKNKGLSQDELAKRLNISRSAISMYESGKRIPNEETKELIADFFNVDMNYLYGKTEIKNSYQLQKAEFGDNGELTKEWIEEVKAINEDDFNTHMYTRMVTQDEHFRYPKTLKTIINFEEKTDINPDIYNLTCEELEDALNYILFKRNSIKQI